MMKNTTDYVFPEDWGLRTPEQKDAWFKEERSFRQVMRQYEAGMYDQWDEERLEGGITIGEALAKADRNEFRKK